MPIFDFKCRKCGHEFEKLVRGNKSVQCASCGAAEVDRLFSLPSVQSEVTHELSMRAARRRDAKQGRERVEEQRNYERNHD